MVKKCFVIAPIGNPESDIRRHTDGLLESVIEPVLKGLDYNVEVSHKIDETGSISKQIIERILVADLVIANLSSLNPNVMYELSIRHCACLPVICLAEVGTVLPFDISDERTIFYRNDMKGTSELKGLLNNAVVASENSSSTDNPVYRVQQSKVLKDIDPTSLDKNGYINEYLQRLEHGMNRLEKTLQQVSAPKAQGLFGLQIPTGGSGITTLLTGEPLPPPHYPNFEGGLLNIKSSKSKSE